MWFWREKEENQQDARELKSLKIAKAPKLYISSLQESIPVQKRCLCTQLHAVHKKAVCLSVVRVWIDSFLENKCVQMHSENIPEPRK